MDMNIIKMIISLPFLIFIVYGLYKQIKHLIARNFKGYKETEGKVVDYKRSYKSDDYGVRTYYSSIIEYIVDDKKYRFVNSLSTSSFREKIDKKKKIMYNPKNPNEVVIKNNLHGITIAYISLMFLISMFHPIFIPIGIALFLLILIINIII